MVGGYIGQHLPEVHDTTKQQDMDETQSKSIKGVKVNNKRSFTNLSCRYCDEGSQETQEHLEECAGCKFERRGLDLSGWVGLVMFWRRMIAKLAATVARWPDAGV